MKNYKTLLFLPLIIALSSCNVFVKFPISDITPAADILAKKGTDNQKNFTLEIVAENLAKAERLNPPGKNYIVWVQTKDVGIKNVGQLTVDNSKKTTFSATTPFDFYEVFITVEDQGDLTYPRGIEIGRVKI